MMRSVYSRESLLAALVLFLAGSTHVLALSWQDIVVEDPTLLAAPVAPWFDCLQPQGAGNLAQCYLSPGSPVGADGSIYFARNGKVPLPTYCYYSAFRQEVWRRTPLGVETRIAYIDEPCSGEAGAHPQHASITSLATDNVAGHLFIYLAYSPTPIETPRDAREIARLEGLPTLFDVFQTYSPETTSFGFYTPAMPEGMAAADHFDTYWGNLTEVGQWSKVKGLQCAYPATPPHVGDYESVADSLPTPAPGSGYYYVTSATYQRQTRYGRKTTAGRQSGRDPALLPACAK